MVSLLERQNIIILSMLALELNIFSPRPFQVDIIVRLYSQNKGALRLIFSCPKAADDKSAVIMGALLMLRGVALSIVPLCPLGLARHLLRLKPVTALTHTMLMSSVRTSAPTIFFQTSRHA